MELRGRVGDGAAQVFHTINQSKQYGNDLEIPGTKSKRV